MTPFGIFHTIVSLIGLVTGAYLLVRQKGISVGNRVGQAYALATFVTAATGLFIFHHGGFGPPHVLAILTLAAVGVALFARSIYVSTVAWSATYFFSWIPGITETTTRLPVSAPLFAGPNAPELFLVNGILFALFVIGATLQVLRIRGRQATSELVFARW